MSAPFEKFRVTTSGWWHGSFNVRVWPNENFSWGLLGAIHLCNAQRDFISDAIREKLERERPAQEGPGK